MKILLICLALVGAGAVAWPESKPPQVLAEVRACGQRIGYVLIQDEYVGSFDVLSDDVIEARDLLVSKGRMRLGRLEFARCAVKP